MTPTLAANLQIRLTSGLVHGISTRPLDAVEALKLALKSKDTLAARLKKNLEVAEVTADVSEEPRFVPVRDVVWADLSGWWIGGREVPEDLPPVKQPYRLHLATFVAIARAVAENPASLLRYDSQSER